MSSTGTWAAILAAIVPVVLAFVAGLCKHADSTTLENGPALPEKKKELDDCLAEWKRKNGAP